jgi:anti-sigma B factor antagonist
MGVAAGYDSPQLSDGQAASFVVERLSGCVVVRVSRELDLLTSPTLRDAVDVAAGFSSHVVVDLSSLTMLDSTGLAVLVYAQSMVSRRGGRMALVGAVRSLRTVLRLTRLDGVLVLYEKLADAVAELTAPRTDRRDAVRMVGQAPVRTGPERAP